MKHKDKIKLAKKMRSGKELKAHVPLFQTKAWLKRSVLIEQRELKKRK